MALHVALKMRTGCPANSAPPTSDRPGGHWACSLHCPAAARQLQIIRLGSAAANPLSRSCNQRRMRTDELSFHLDACRSGFPVSARLPKTVGVSPDSE